MLYVIQSWTQRAQAAIDNQEPCGYLLQQLEGMITELQLLQKAKNPVELPEDFIEMTYSFFGYAEEKGLDIYRTAERLNFVLPKHPDMIRPYHVDEQGRMFYSDTGKRNFQMNPERVLEMQEADKGPYISLKEVQAKAKARRSN